MKISVKPLSTGYFRVSGQGPCNWAQPFAWPCDEAIFRASAFPEASEEFIVAALAYMRTTQCRDVPLQRVSE